MKRHALALAAVAAAGLMSAATAAAAANYPIGTYVYAGTVKNHRNEAMTAASGLQIQAVATNGTVLAVSSVVDPDAEGVNFRLEVPVSTVASDRSAAIGDAPRCVVVRARGARGARGAATEPLPTILCASAVTNCIVVWTDAESFTSADGGATVLVPVDYLEGLSDRAAALQTFVNGLDADRDGQIDVPGVSDILIGIKAYSRNGN